MELLEQIRPTELTAEEQLVLDALLESFWDESTAREMILQNRIELDIDDSPEPIRRFAVSDLSSANWVLKQIAENQKQALELEALANEEILHIKQRLERIQKPLQNRISFLQGAYSLQLEDWAKSELEGKKTKSINLIHGKVGFRKSPDKVVLDVEEEKAIEEFKLLGFYDLIRVKEEVNKTALKKQLQEQNSETYVAHIEPGSENFYFNAELPE